MRRKQLTMSGKTEVSTTTVSTPTHHPGYAPNAAFHAIKRHALEFVNPKELMVRLRTSCLAFYRKILKILKSYFLNEKM